MLTAEEWAIVHQGPYTEHVTRDGDRWDLIAYRYYGDATRYEPIVYANPAIAIDPVLPGGLHLLVPQLPAAVVTGTDDLPPWKRA